MDERMMTPEEEAVMNIELFKTEELFRDRVRAVMLELLRDDSEINNTIENVANRRISTFKESLLRNIQNAY